MSDRAAGLYAAIADEVGKGGSAVQIPMIEKAFRAAEQEAVQRERRSAVEYIKGMSYDGWNDIVNDPDKLCDLILSRPETT